MERLKGRVATAVGELYLGNLPQQKIANRNVRVQMQFVLCKETSGCFFLKFPNQSKAGNQKIRDFFVKFAYETV